MQVAEIFYSIQGEGSHAGIPMVFVRLQGCSVGCSWCDTKDSWNPTMGENMEVAQIIEEVSKHSVLWVCVTGGEPAEHNTNPLISALMGRGYYVAVETSGQGKFAFLAGTHVVLSPKVSLHEVPPVNLEIVRQSREFKFVIGQARDLDRVDAFVARWWPWVHHNPPVLSVQPVWGSTGAQHLCLDYLKRSANVRLSVQTHKYLSLR